MAALCMLAWARVWIPNSHLINDRRQLICWRFFCSVSAVTGSRIRLRLFGGFDYTEQDFFGPDFTQSGYRKRFRIGVSEGGVDGAQETDGLAVTSASLGDAYAEGLLVVQDGFNAPKGSTQNFKYVDLRAVLN